MIKKEKELFIIRLFYVINNKLSKSLMGIFFNFKKYIIFFSQAEIKILACISVSMFDQEDLILV